jgi:hypothetical protein
MQRETILLVSLSLSATFATCECWSGILINGYWAGTQLYLPSNGGDVVNVSLGLNHYIHAAAVIHRSNVYNTGGLYASSQTVVQILNTLTNTTRVGRAMNVARYWHAATVAANYIYVCGGRNDSVYNFNSCERYSTKTEKWRIIQGLPIASAGLTMATLNGNVYTFGGYISLAFTTNTTHTYLNRELH